MVASTSAAPLVILNNETWMSDKVETEILPGGNLYVI